MTQGRFPSHLLLSHSVQCTQAECVAGCPIAEMDKQSGIRKGATSNSYSKKSVFGNGSSSIIGDAQAGYNDTGYASRYFQQFRPSPSNPRGALLQYLTRLITPPGGIVLDPFGSHDTARACQDEGFSYVGIEAEVAEE